MKFLNEKQISEINKEIDKKKEFENKISILEAEIAELKEFNTKLIQSLNSSEILI